MRFKVIPEILFELCSGQKLRMKINKGQYLHKYDGQSYDSCALHFSLMRSIHLCSFKMIPEILLSYALDKNVVYRPTDGPTDKCKAIYPRFFEGGHNNSAMD